MKFLIVTLSAVAMAASAPGFAQTEAAPTADAKPAKAKKEPKICHKALNTGSRMAKSICKTAEEWANQEGTSSFEPAVTGNHAQ